MKEREQDQPKKRLSLPIPLRENGVLSWRFLAALTLIGCVVTEILFNIMPIDHDTLLMYWFFPVSLVLLTQLYFGLRFTKHREIRFLLVYLAWMCLTVLLNRNRAHLVEAYPWFMCVITVLFLCFSLPYAFDQKTASRVMTALAVATVLAVAFLSIVSLLSVYTNWFSGMFPSFSEGIFFDGGRLRIDNHPNRSAPAQAVAVILIGYLLARSRKRWQRVAWVLCGVLCYIPLALTVSRTGIIGAGLAIGFEVYLVLREVLKPRMKTVLRVFLCAIAACVSLVAIYEGAELVVGSTTRIWCVSRLPRRKRLRLLPPPRRKTALLHRLRQPSPPEMMLLQVKRLRLTRSSQEIFPTRRALTAERISGAGY